jgi:hypothetical protein
MLIYSPRWLFLVPGLLLTLFGGVFASILSFTALRIGNTAFDAGSLAVACMLAIVGVQLVAFAFFTKVFATGEGLLPPDRAFANVFKYFTLEKAVVIWKQAHYGALPYDENMRRLIPAVTLVVLGIQVIFSSFFMSVLGLKTASRQPPSHENP